jgi:NAD(P)-dependent dehydrogenase (short-subunit alcohol dehydrogenase family)
MAIVATGAVLVTGGGRGIGAAVCHKLAAAGYGVAVNYLDQPEAAAKTVDQIIGSGGRARAFRADVADEDAVRILFAAAAESLGKLVGLVNNAGILGGYTRLEHLDLAVLHRTLAVNVIGTILCAREAVRTLSTARGGGGGAIVNLSSVAARTGGGGEFVHYAASKGAIESFTVGLAREVAAEGIRVNAVAPGLIDTDANSAERKSRVAAEIPLGRIGATAEIAEAVAWLLSPASSYVTGAVLTVSGGR